MADTRDDDDGRDATHGGMPPPPGAKSSATAPEPKEDETAYGRGMPILPGGQAPAGAAAKPSEEEAAAAQPDVHSESPTIADDDLEATVIGGVASPFSLMRLKPAGHPLPIKLDRNSYVIGRSRNVDIPLFSGTAHRRHAKLSSREGGWILEPFENNVVIADGDLVRGEVRLVHKMRLQLGDDELIFFDEYKAAVPSRGAATANTAPPRSARRRVLLLAVIAAAIAVAGALLW